MQVATIGLDIAKNVFQVHGVDARGRTVLRKRLARARLLGFFANLPRAVIGLEAWEAYGPMVKTRSNRTALAVTERPGMVAG